jgi:hypothetical protein|tara:strand:+ start:977 stop:1765 length:789 start_codon:yes stop_codon:yes gene_type:complete
MTYNILSISDEIIDQIGKMETPADKILHQLYSDCRFQTEKGKKAIRTRGIFFNMNIEKWNHIRNILNKLIYEYNSGLSDIEIFKNATNIDVLVLEKCVIRLFSSDKLSLVHQKLFEIRNDSKHLEHFFTHSTSEDPVSYIVSEKLIPLMREDLEEKKHHRVSGEISIDVLCAEVFEALTYLHKNGIQHSDAKIENIGIRPTDGSFVFFDLQCVLVPGVTEREKTVETDFKDFIISLKGHFKNHERLHLYSDFPNIFLDKKGF